MVSLLFCFRIIASKKLIFDIYITLKETFGETHGHTSRKCEVENVENQNYPKNPNCTQPFLLQNNSLKMLIFDVFLPLGEPLVAKFKEMRAPTSSKDLVKEDKNFKNMRKT